MGSAGPQKLIGAYALGPFIGAGPVGDVYRVASGPNVDRELALKVVRPPLAHSPAARDRFLRLAPAVAQLDHPHILPLEFAGEQSGQLLTVMPLVTQGSLMTRLARGRLSPRDIPPLFKQLCDALGYAQSRRLIHGNLKPTNVLLFEGRHVLLADFGQIWQVVEVDLTQSGLSAEAVAYMAPEQADGMVDGRCDIYALGALLFYALTGAPPFAGRTPFEMLSRHQRQPVPSLLQSNPPLSPAALAYDEVIRMALAKDPAARFQTPAAMARALVEAERQAESLPSRILPTMRPSGPPLLSPPGMAGRPPSMPLRPPGPPRPSGPPNMPGPPRPVGPPSMPIFPGPGPLNRGMPPAPGGPLPLPPTFPPPGGPLPQLPPPPANDPLSWLIPDAGAPSPLLDVATERHAADGLPPMRPPIYDTGELGGGVSRPTGEAGAARDTGTGATPRARGWDEPREFDDSRSYAAPGWDDEDDSRNYPARRDDSRGYPATDTDDSRSYRARRDDARDYPAADDSRNLATPSMRSPSRSRPARDRWEESAPSGRMPSRPRGDPADSGLMTGGRDSAVIPGRAAGGPSRPLPQGAGRAAAKRRAPSRWPAVLGVAATLFLLMDLLTFATLFPTHCPGTLCDSVRTKVAAVLSGQRGANAAPVSVQIAPQSPALTASPGGTTVNSQRVTLTSLSVATLQWTASTDTPWVTVTPASGALVNGAPIPLTITMAPPASLTLGSYQAALAVRAGGGVSALALAIAVVAPPRLTLDKAALTITACQQTQTVTITNPGALPITNLAATPSDDPVQAKLSAATVAAGGTVTVAVSLTCAASQGTNYAVYLVSPQGSATITITYG